MVIKRKSAQENFLKLKKSTDLYFVLWTGDLFCLICTAAATKSFVIKETKIGFFTMDEK